MNDGKLFIHGTVLCPDCGCQIISNSGKIMGMFNQDEILKLQCWGCGAGYDAEECYRQREKDKIIIFRREE